jgi:cytosolic carboxypeptidase protein 2/3
MCRSVGGLPIYQLTIKSANGNTMGPNKKKKKVIYITSRVHAGETYASIVMQKLISELSLTGSGNRHKYESLLNSYVIKLVPMINVDGVVIGNARTSLVGLDLNRRWT